MTNPPSTPSAIAAAEQSHQTTENYLITHFDQLTPDMLTAISTMAIKEADAVLLGIVPGATNALTGEPQVLEALRTANTILGSEVGEVGIVFDLLGATHPDESVRTAATNEQTNTQKFADSIVSNSNYQLRSALEAIDPATLDPQGKQQYDYYIALLKKSEQVPSAETAGSTAELRSQLTEAQTAFANNNKNVVSTRISNEDFRLLPPDTQNQLAATSDENGYTIQLSGPNLTSILEVGPRDLRKQVYETYYGERVAGNDQLIQQMADLRLAIARGEGKETWTALQIEGLTLGTVDSVTEFYDGVKDGIIERYQETIAKLQVFLEADGETGPLQEYDIPYYMQQLIKKSYDTTQITFTFEKTMRGLWNMAEGLFDIKVEDAPDTPVWAPEVKAYTVHDAKTSEALGTIFADPFARDGKRNGGATYALQYGQEVVTKDGEKQPLQLPVAATVTNLAAPSSTGVEAKMNIDKVAALSHEGIGHGLHITFARTRGPQFGGDQLPFDIREIVSQAFEYLVRDPSVVLTLADEGIPQDVKEAFMKTQDDVQKSVAALNDMRLLQVTGFDLAMHNSQQPNIQAALQQFEALAGSVNTEGHALRTQPHLANSYAGRYHTYLVCNEGAKNVVTWLRSHNYSHAEGAKLKKIMELGGSPGAGSELLALTARAKAIPKVTHSAGHTAVTSSEI